jgi:DNA topoisomerase IB
VQLDFVGKAGKRNTAAITDPQLAEYLKARIGDRTSGQLFSTDRRNITSAMQAAGVSAYKPKDFRTLYAGRLAARELAAIKPPPPLPKKPAARKKLVSSVVRQVSTTVANDLNNTPAMARNSYISPAIFQSWMSDVGLTGGAMQKADTERADRIWRKALEIDLPGHDKPLQYEPEYEDELPEDLEQDPLPEQLQ